MKYVQELYIGKKIKIYTKDKYIGSEKVVYKDSLTNVSISGHYQPESEGIILNVDDLGFIIMITKSNCFIENTTIFISHNSGIVFKFADNFNLDEEKTKICRKIMENII